MNRYEAIKYLKSKLKNKNFIKHSYFICLKTMEEVNRDLGL